MISRREMPRAAFTIGIPAALYMVDDLYLWKRFFARLSIPVLTSEGCGDAEETGKYLAGAEFCAPLCALYGHVQYLLKRSDYVFLPFYFERKTGEKRCRRQYCYYSQFAPSLARAIDGGAGEKLLTPLIHYLYPAQHAKRELHAMLNALFPKPIRFSAVSSAYDEAQADQERALSEWRKIYRENTVGISGIHVVLLGRPYTVLDKSMNKGIPEIFSALGIKAFYQDMLSYTEKDVVPIAHLLREIHWLYASMVLKAAYVVAGTRGAYPVLITSFKCAPDSFAIECFRQIMEDSGKPYLILQLDEHDSSVGYETRIEAALHSFLLHHETAREPARPRKKEAVRSSGAVRLKEKTLLIPSWDPITSRFLAANLRRSGINAHPLEESEGEIRKGLRHNAGQCLPVNIIAQEYIDYIAAHDLDPGRTMLWMVRSLIPCNLKMYPRHIRSILNSHGNGMERAGVYTGDLSMMDISRKLPFANYLAYLFGGTIRKIGCRLRPYEREKGMTDGIVRKATDLLEHALLGHRTLEEAVGEAVSAFAAIPLRNIPRRPRVAIFGDLYARDNEIFNRGLIGFIEENGGEAVTVPYSSYMKMISAVYFRKWRTEGLWSDVLSGMFFLPILKHKEKKYTSCFQEILKEPEPEFDASPEEILAPYHLRMEHTGESMDNILKIFYIQKYHPDISLLVQVSPAFCCPSLVTEAMARRIEEKTGIRMISITYDGTGGNQNESIIPYLAETGTTK